MRLIFHGILEELVGSEARMEAANIAEALEGFSRQHPNWPKDVRVEIVGFREEALFYSEKPEEIHIMPALQGGGGKFGSIIMGAVTAAVGAAIFFFVPGGQTIGISLMVSGAMMMVQGVIGLFMKAPKMDKQDEVDGSKIFGVNRNTTNARTPITMAWGRVNLYPHWLSLQSDSSNLSHGSYPVNPT